MMPSLSANFFLFCLEIAKFDANRLGFHYIYSIGVDISRRMADDVIRTWFGDNELGATCWAFSALPDHIGRCLNFSVALRAKKA